MVYGVLLRLEEEEFLVSSLSLSSHGLSLWLNFESLHPLRKIGSTFNGQTFGSLNIKATYVFCIGSVLVDFSSFVC